LWDAGQVTLWVNANYGKKLIPGRKKREADMRVAAGSGRPEGGTP
jgi:hypothetical protein